MAPPPPAMLNGNLSNGIANNNNKQNNIITPPNHAGLLKEIETGNKSQIIFLLFLTRFYMQKKTNPRRIIKAKNVVICVFDFSSMTGISLRKVEPQQNRSTYNQGDLMREIREGE